MKNSINSLFLKIIICMFFIFTLTGCYRGREINDLEIVVGMGVDKDKLPSNIRLVAQVVKPIEMRKPTVEGIEQGGKAFWNVSSAGETVFEAARGITHKTGNRLFVPHSQIVIFGNKVAKEGLQQYTDFFLRSREIRPTTFVLVSEGTAEDILDTKPSKEKLPAVNITKLINSYGFTSQYPKINLQDFSNRLLSKTTSPIAPLVKVTKSTTSTDHYVYGTAVFKNVKMVGTLNEMETRGLLWVTNKVKSGVISVNAPKGQGKVILEILNAKSKVTPEISNGKVIMHVKIEEKASLAEQTTSENMTTFQALEELQKAQEDAIRQEILSAFEKSRLLNADVFGFGDSVHKKYRNEWKEMEDMWDEIYPSIEIQISIETKIIKSDLLTKPAVPEKGEKK